VAVLEDAADQCAIDERVETCRTVLDRRRVVATLYLHMYEHRVTFTYVTRTL